jgi:hypothetical protein
VQPLALTKLALLLMEIEKEHKNRDSKPMVIGVDDESSGVCMYSCMCMCIEIYEAHCYLS